PSYGALTIAGDPVAWPAAMSCDAGTPATCTLALTYTPTTGYEGADSFTFTVNDGTASSLQPGTIGITVGSAPVANDDPQLSCFDTSSFGGAFPIPEDWPSPFVFNGSCGVLANDTDADG